MREPRILYISPILDNSGYAEVSRNYVQSLYDCGCDLVTRILKYDNGNYNLPTRIRELSTRGVQDIDVIIQQTTPPELEYKPGVMNVCAFCWETDRIPPEWASQLNKMDLILVPIEENRIVVQKCGVIKPVEVIPYSFDTSKYKKSVAPYEIRGANGHFKFLGVCQYSKKKGVDALLKAYLTEFMRNEPVLLVLKVYIGINDGDEEKGKILGIINDLKRMLRLDNYPLVKLVHGVSSHEDIDRLYNTCDCYCLSSRGEGWSVPHFDALGWGLPSIGVEGTGPEEFIDDSCGWIVKSTPSPVINMPHPHQNLYTAKENWREPDVLHLRTAMRDAYELFLNNNSEWDKMCDAARSKVFKYDNSVVGPQLKEVIMKYYREWKDYHVH